MHFYNCSITVQACISMNYGIFYIIPPADAAYVTLSQPPALFIGIIRVLKDEGLGINKKAAGFLTGIIIYIYKRKLKRERGNSVENTGVENKTGKSKAKIIMLIVIVLIVAGIWMVKNLDIFKGDYDVENPDFVLEAAEELDLEHLKTYGLPIILDFGSESCPPCRQMAPDLKKVHREKIGKAIIKYVDVWENPDLAEGFPLSVIPTQIFFDKEGDPYKPSDPEKYRMIIYNNKDTDDHIYTAHEGGLTEKQMLEILKEMGMEE